MKIKKMATLFLATILVMTAALGLTAQAAVDILDGAGSFDVADTAALEAKGWIIAQTEGEQVANITFQTGCDENGNDATATSDTAFTVDNSGTARTTTLQYKLRCARGGTYTLSGWLWAEKYKAGSRPTLYVSSSNEDGTLSGSSLTDPSESLYTSCFASGYTDKTWVRFTVTFDAPINRDFVWISFYDKMAAKVKFDDVVISGPPVPLAEYETNTVLFYKEDGTKLESLDGVETVYATYKPDGTASAEENLTLAMAVYKMVEDKKQLVNFYVDSGKPGYMYTEFDMPKEDGDYTVSAFVWDSFTGLRAISEKFDLQ